MPSQGPTALERFVGGILPENPVYRQLLGMCPTLAVTGGMKPAMTMAGATAFVLISANVIVSLIRGLLKPHLRILVFTLTIATFVTIADLILKAVPALYPMSKELGPYVPLISAAPTAIWIRVMSVLSMGNNRLLIVSVRKGRGERGKKESVRTKEQLGVFHAHFSSNRPSHNPPHTLSFLPIPSSSFSLPSPPFPLFPSTPFPFPSVFPSAVRSIPLPPATAPA